MSAVAPMERAILSAPSGAPPPPLTAAAPDAFQLAPDEVHVWCVGLDVLPDAAARLCAILPVEERNRSARFRFPRDRRHFIVARGVLRELLARYLQTQPDQISYAHNAFGKPDLSPRFGGRLKFNLSHSGDLALIAIAPGSHVGIDLEYIREQSDYSEVAKRFFPPAEVKQLNALPSHRYAEAFLSCWTKMEAYLKARGSGLGASLNRSAFPLRTDPEQGSSDVLVTANDTGHATRWSIYTLRPAPGYVGALTIEGTGWRLSQQQYAQS